MNSLGCGGKCCGNSAWGVGRCGRGGRPEFKPKEENVGVGTTPAFFSEGEKALPAASSTPTACPRVGGFPVPWGVCGGESPSPGRLWGATWGATRVQSEVPDSTGPALSRCASGGNGPACKRVAVRGVTFLFSGSLTCTPKTRRTVQPPLVRPPVGTTSPTSSSR